MKVFNKPKEAEKLRLSIIDAGKDAVISVDLKDIPAGESVESFLQKIKDSGIVIIDSDETCSE